VNHALEVAGSAIKATGSVVVLQAQEHPVIATAVVGGVIVVGAPFVVLPALGFGATGVAGGSIAAGLQSAVYGGFVAGGGVFATLQSAGVAGVAITTKIGLGTAGAAAGTWIGKQIWD